MKDIVANIWSLNYKYINEVTILIIKGYNTSVYKLVNKVGWDAFRLDTESENIYQFLVKQSIR